MPAEHAPSFGRSNGSELRLDRLVKRFSRGEPAVQIDELRIRAGEFVTLVGPSGCGKTTTMRMIAGLEDPSEGEIYFGGKPVVDLSVQRRNVAMVFQNYALYPHMRVSENLEYGLKKRGVPRAEREVRVLAVARMLRIDGMLDRRPRQLSGGEQQRVALGRAIIRTPEVLLLDEPLSNLDAKLRTFMRAELVKLQRQVGCTTVFVTHDQLEAMTMSDRIAVMRSGRIQQFDTPQDIYNHPANLFVAGFIGSPPMNFIAGTAEGGGGGCTFRAQGLQLHVSDADCGGRLRPGDGRQVTLGIRPEHVGLDGGSGDLAAVVSVVELIGAEKYVFLESEAGELIARTNADARLQPGDRLFCRFQRGKIRMFDSTTERACVEPLA
ncbi:MAG: ABC transporter ATP-binding protein [Rhodobacteraceae bacterium]|nr:ABC transporter ATP-binding protein [Paracoccaceae bacterium]